MLVYRYYDEDEKVDHAWFSSSSVLYSECDDITNDFKVLRVTFKNGATYKYMDVDVNDYVMFLAGGTDGSHGKALAKFIKPKYKYEKISDIDPIDINRKMTEYKEKEKREKA